MDDLVASGHAPAEFVARLEYVNWSGEYKDLTFVPDAAPADVVLVDDDGGWVAPGQHGQWLEIERWDGGSDHELDRVRVALEGRLMTG